MVAGKGPVVCKNQSPQRFLGLGGVRRAVPYDGEWLGVMTLACDILCPCGERGSSQDMIQRSDSLASGKPLTCLFKFMPYSFLDTVTGD